MTPAQKKWIQMIHVAKSKTGVSEEVYRAMLQGSAGVESAKDVTNWEQYNAVMAGFKVLGFRAKRKAVEAQKERNPDWITAKQEYYITGLWHLASQRKDESSLRAMCKRITGVSDIRFCPKNKATALILALRDITKKAGYHPDSKFGV